MTDGRMTDGRPDALELLDATLGWLDAELLPALDGAARYRARVAANVLRIVRRELALRDAHAHDERADLSALIGADAVDAATARATLVERIGAGRFALDDPALLAYLERSLRRTLAIDHPGWTDSD